MPTAEELAQSQNQQTQTDPATDIGNVVNAAVTSHLKRANIGKLITDAVEAAMKPVRDQEAARAATVAASAEPLKPVDPKASPEFAALQRQFEDMSGKFKQETEARAAAEKRQREDRAYADLRAGLAAAGIKADMVDIAADNLFYAKKKVEFDEQGTPLFRHTKTTPGYGDEDELLPLSAGIQAFAKSKDAAPFLPSPGVNKSQPLPRQGTRNPATPPAAAVGTAVSEEDKIANSMARSAALKAQFGDS